MKRGVIIFAALFSGALLCAQNSNLNPTVQVTNTYESRIQNVDRQVMKVAVPDSLYKFDLNFNYTGFENPYKGNEEFNPFFTELDIAERTLKSKDLYLKAGAGYTLHPVLDAAYSFKPLGRFKAGVFAHHKSYYGDYYRACENQDNFKGYDAVTKVGFNARSDWDKLSLIAGVWYDGIHTQNNFRFKDTRNFNAASAALKVVSNYDADAVPWKYEFTAGYSYGGNGFVYRSVKGFEAEHSINVGGSGNFKIGNSLIELAAGCDVKTGIFTDRYNGYAVNLTPRYYYVTDKIDLGVGCDFLVSWGNNVQEVRNIADDPEYFALWPSVDFTWRAVPTYLDVFVKSGLKGSLYGQGDIARDYRFLLEEQFCITKTRTIDFGLKGDVCEKFSWKVKASYEWLSNAVNAAVTDLDNSYVMLVCDSAVHDFNFGIDLRAKFGGFSLDGDVTYNLYLNPRNCRVVPPAWIANLRLEYEFLNRAGIYVGAEYKSAYKADKYTVPDWINLYVGAEYKLTNRLKIFLDGRNLLNRQCQFIPMYAEKGVAITVGAVLNF